MTSGRLEVPLVLRCEFCGGEMLWTGGRPPKWCSRTCIPRNRLQYGPPKWYHLRLDPEEKLRRHRQRGRDTAKITRARHQEIVRLLRRERGSCADCGLVVEERTMPCFAWDHRDRSEKLFTIAQGVGRRSLEELIAEIAKCDLVCHNCHAIRTAEGRHWEPVAKEATLTR